jgi:hypothetical protein
MADGLLEQKGWSMRTQRTITQVGHLKDW